MKKQLIFVHGGESFESREEYLEYLRTTEVDPFRGEERRWHKSFPEVLGVNWDVLRVSMPCKDNADYEAWGIWFTRHIPFMREGSVLVGHSLGANFLTAYLDDNTAPIHFSALHLVAGCAGEGSFPFPSDGANIKRQIDKVYLYHSKNDPVVAFSDMEKYADILPTAEKVVFEDRGHFLGEDFPELIERVKAQ